MRILKRIVLFCALIAFWELIAATPQRVVQAEPTPLPPCALLPEPPLRIPEAPPLPCDSDFPELGSSTIWDICNRYADCNVEPPCGEIANCYAVVITLADGVDWGGAHARWETRDYEPFGGFAAHLMWVHTESPPTADSTDWIEIGVFRGFLPGLYCPGSLFWYRSRGGPTVDDEYGCLSDSLGSPGSKHTYTVQQHTSSTYRLYFDFNLVKEIPASTWVNRIDVGVETTSPYAQVPTNTTDGMQFRDQGCCSGSWHYWQASNPAGSTGPPYYWDWITQFHAGVTGET